MSEQLFSNIVINLAIMLFLIIFLGFVVVKLKKIKQFGMKHLKFIGSISLGHKERIAVIEFYDKKILVGVSSGQMNTLAVHVENDKEKKEVKFEQSMKDVLALKGIHVNK